MLLLIFYLLVSDKRHQYDKTSILDLTFQGFLNGNNLKNNEILVDKSSFKNNAMVVCSGSYSLSTGINSIQFTLPDEISRNYCHLRIKSNQILYNLVNGDFSLELWFNPRDNLKGSYIILMKSFIGIKEGYVNGRNKQNGPSFYFENSCRDKVHTIDFEIQNYDNKIHHYMATFDASKKILTQYLDGGQVGQDSVCSQEGIKRSITDLVLGTSEDSFPKDYRGQIYSLRIMKRVIQEDEVERLSNLIPNQIELKQATPIGRG